jgi:UDP-GlcNAc3NAcA epimerase
MVVSSLLTATHKLFRSEGIEMKTIVTIVGARPQFIKVAPVSAAFRKCGRIREILVHTGQHFDTNMSDVFFSELEISKPDYSLEVNGGGHGAMTGAMLQKLEPLLLDLKPDMVLVYGDTNSTLAGALVAAKLHLPVAHVEAGLRSFNRKMPEEINRVMTDHLASILFSTTDTSTQNLRNEGIDASTIHQVGDVMFDAALQFAARAKTESKILKSLGLTDRQFILATIHRAENTDQIENLNAIVAGLEMVAATIPVILPLHPRTRNALARAGQQFKSVTLVEPLGYLDMVALESQAAVIATDSGGVQKEAFFYQVPCVVLREETEWVELIDLGWNELAPPRNGEIAQMVLKAIGRKGKLAHPYGDGHAATRIADLLKF